MVGSQVEETSSLCAKSKRSEAFFCMHLLRQLGQDVLECLFTLIWRYANLQFLLRIRKILHFDGDGHGQSSERVAGGSEAESRRGLGIREICLMS